MIRWQLAVAGGQRAALALTAFVWLLPASAVAQVRPTCRQVIAEVTRNITMRRGEPAGAVAVAKTLDTDLAWVQRCMEVYGRIPAGRGKMRAAEREVLQEAIEEDLTIEEVLERRRDLGEEVPAFAEQQAPRPKRRKPSEGLPYDPLEKSFEAPFEHPPGR